ncbi:MBL fold metallo-hydrolase [Leptospira sarikeiensis]|uniref:MBL fold metallo-hydrolase n=1 Tax=Leptospira sarikeiensis TaxID=2484943 RepID=A0A4R9KEG5_9LEPT|nr:MBL fold metallo-hydrolase [Leptospira sarikeiensis]
MKPKQFLYLFLPFLLLGACAVTSKRSTPITQGNPTEFETLDLSEKGPIRFQKILAADWVAERNGLIHLKDPKAVAANLEPGKEPIQIYFYVIDHPKFGRYIIDTGMSSGFRKPQEEWPVPGFISSRMNGDKLKTKITIQEWLAKDPKKVEGAFLTHMHMDHIFGSLDLPAGTPLITGPGESADSRFIHLFVQSATDRILGENISLSELKFDTKDGKTTRILDYFGDKSFYVIYVPGHTAGSLAFLIKSTNGSQLVLGDTCHTKWGWENQVPPGEYTKDREANIESLNYLKQISLKFPKIQVHPGHQSIGDK